MLKSLIQHLNCEGCGQALVYNPKATFDIYQHDLNATIENVNIKVEEIIGNFLVYDCPKCKSVYKYTYKEIEKAIRLETTKQVLLSIARGQMSNVLNIMDGVFVYCGKCSGFDGKGSCTRKIYEKCEVKSFVNS